MLSEGTRLKISKQFAVSGIQPGRSWPEDPNLVKKLELRCKGLQPLLKCTRLKSVFGKWRPANGEAKAADRRNFRLSVRCSTSQTQEPSTPGPLEMLTNVYLTSLIQPRSNRPLRVSLPFALTQWYLNVRLTCDDMFFCTIYYNTINGTHH